MKSYAAPWSKSLLLISSLVTVICLGIAVVMTLRGQGWIALLPLIILGWGGLFTIRGYVLTNNSILVRRLLWATRVPLAGLKTAQFDPDAMNSSIRTFANGGVFAFSGFFANKTLGAYRAFVTDPRRTVVLHFPSSTIVISPAAPEELVHDLGVWSPPA